MLGLPIPSIDTLLSLPLLSFLVLPSFLSSFSWTTSLNFLFFWLTWVTVVFSHSALKIEFFGTFAVKVVFYLIPCASFLVLDAGVPSFSTSIKSHGAVALPHRAASRRTLWGYLGVVLFNIVASVALQTAIDYGFTEVFSTRSVVRISMSLPMPLALAKDLTRAYLVRGPLAYYIHRYCLHATRRESNPTTLQLTHWHNEWQHSLATTMPFAASYDHPAVYLLHRFLPVYLPALMFRFHFLTYLAFVALTSLEEAFAYSGYSVLPSTILLAGAARRTEAHFMTGGGNYGPWGVMDWVHGTTLGEEDVMDDIEEEANKHNVRGKAKRVVDKTSSAIREHVEAATAEADSTATEVEEAPTRHLRSRK